MTPHARRRGRDQSGQSAVEFVGWVALLLFVALAAIQLGIVAYAAQQAGTAARAGARVASRGGDGEAAAYAAMSGWLAGQADVEAEAGGESAFARVSVDIPTVLPALDIGTAERTATMPVTDPPDD
ncbi:TadE/TadG family type IV pilus assembly protein [Streptomyces sp. NPDC050856]|uniref:TadE/TadG family type IV pilus assembly protein n=1 Tax=unclassified Streptomyces TaxID=2593676 RepID=UPI0034046C46